jgi:hypothetical protein
MHQMRISTKLRPFSDGNAEKLEIRNSKICKNSAKEWDQIRPKRIKKISETSRLSFNAEIVLKEQVLSTIDIYLVQL